MVAKQLWALPRFSAERGRRNEEWIGGGLGEAVGGAKEKGRTSKRVPKAKVMNNLVVKKKLEAAGCSWPIMIRVLHNEKFFFNLV